MSNNVILASASESRLKLLKQISIIPSQIFPANIDETALQNELPRNLAHRLSIEKVKEVAKHFKSEFIIAADTVTACGRRILPKPLNDEDVRYCLDLLSGRRSKIYTGLTICKLGEGSIVKISSRIVTSILKFKRLTNLEIEDYIKSKEGLNKGGGLKVEGIAESFIIWMSGSYSNIIGLPLYETKSLLYGMGYNK